MLAILCRTAADLTALLAKAAAPRAKLMYTDTDLRYLLIDVFNMCRWCISDQTSHQC